MFSLFKKRQPTLMDQTIKANYGEKPPRKSANVADAVRLAADNLLCGTTDVGRLASLATELDAGPIIAQDVARISHRHTVADLIRRGQDLECSVFAQAIRSHLENRVLVYNNKTVVFD